MAGTWWKRLNGVPGRRSLPMMLVLLAGLAAAAPVHALESSNTELDINALLGAPRFYDAGHTGSLSIQANIEAGHAWDGHVTLGHIEQFITGFGATGAYDDHATAASHAMGGRGGTPLALGLGYDATLWSGAIATSIDSDGSFEMTFASVATAYTAILQAGVGPANETAHVFNSSWSFEDPTGTHAVTMGIDGLIKANGTVGVFAAGNDGNAGENTVGAAASGYNTIAVGSVGPDFTEPAYENVSASSSRGPQDFYHAGTGATLAGVRAPVDLVAPGQNLTLAAYLTEEEVDELDQFEQEDRPYLVRTNRAGTSFAAPIVAGGASLLVDAGRSVYSDDPDAIDGRVVKAVLLNSAAKMPDWDNGQTLSNGTEVTTQSLDWEQGAGRMDLDAAFDQYISRAEGGRAGTTNVAGFGSGDLGDVANIGWDFGEVARGDENRYFIDQLLTAGTDFTATLTWFIDRDADAGNFFIGASDQRFANLDLQLFRFDNLEDRNILDTVALSESTYNVVEHLHLTLAETGYYGLGVRYDEDLWNFNDLDTELYALAWVPEPGSLAVLLAVLAGLALCRPGRADQPAVLVLVARRER